MHGIRVATAVVLLAMGCSGAPPDETTGGGGGVAGGGKSSGEGSSGVSNGSSSGGASSGGATSGSSSSGGAACAHTGIWSGPVEGTYVDLLKPDKRLPVTGSATVKFKASGGAFQIDADSGIEIVLTDILGPGRNATVKRPLTGTSTCEAMKAEGNGDTGILKVNVTADCKFAGDKCTGAWNAVTPGEDGEADKEVANGTFSVSRKE